MTFQTTMIGLKMKIKENKSPFYLLFIFWLIGFILFYINAAEKDFLNIFFISLTVRQPETTSDFAGIYQLLFPILIEVIVFGFLISVLLEKYNPIATCRIMAEHKRNHSVVLGFAHLGERLVDYFIENKKEYTLIEFDKQKVNDLINSGEPVVVGDFTEEASLIDAGIPHCKEVFCASDTFRVGLIAAKKIRKMNCNCKMFFRIYNDRFTEYLGKEPWKVFTFSTSKWTMKSIKKWDENKTGNVIVLGDDHIARKIVQYVSQKEKRTTFYCDPDVDPDDYNDQPLVHFSQTRIFDIEDLEKKTNLSEIEQIFICWRSEKTFDKAILLIMELDEKYPNLEKFIRIYDEEAAEIMQQYHAKTFSTSSYAFKMLSEGIAKSSIIVKDIEKCLE